MPTEIQLKPSKESTLPRLALSKIVSHKTHPRFRKEKRKKTDLSPHFQSLIQEVWIRGWKSVFLKALQVAVMLSQVGDTMTQHIPPLKVIPIVRFSNCQYKEF